jgi:hypothetical protein
MWYVAGTNFCKHGGNFKQVTMNVNKTGLLYSDKYYYIVYADFNVL